MRIGDMHFHGQLDTEVRILCFSPATTTPRHERFSQSNEKKMTADGGIVLLKRQLVINVQENWCT
jgi:hypothetical protein